MGSSYSIVRPCGYDMKGLDNIVYVGRRVYVLIVLCFLIVVAIGMLPRIVEFAL